MPQSHRELYPDQYAHPLCGKRVRVKSDDHEFEDVVERVVMSRFGELAILEGQPHTKAWSVRSCTPI